MNATAKMGFTHHAKAAGTRQNDWLGFLPLIVLPALILIFRASFPPWWFMWILAFAIFAGCKWLTWWQVGKNTAPPWQHWAYLLAWPGLNAKEFLTTSVKIPEPTFTAWLGALTKTLFGAILLFGVARRLPEHQVILIGWCGLFGMIFLLHFGTFHLLSLFWQKLGLNARPLMRAPILATSLGAFWGKRWNSAFTSLAQDTLLKRLHHYTGVTGAMLIVFLVSGLIRVASREKDTGRLPG